jgi:hypothetical protein
MLLETLVYVGGDNIKVSLREMYFENVDILIWLRISRSDGTLVNKKMNCVDFIQGGEFLG